MTDIIPSSEKGQALQDAIQKQLSVLGYTTEDDTVMAEYCLVMLGNKKTPDQITTELTDLIGGADFDPTFVTWLFDTVQQLYHDNNSTTILSPAATAFEHQAPIGVIQDSRTAETRTFTHERRLGPGRNGSGVFGHAMTGMKRDARGLSDNARDAGANVRPRYEQRTEGFDGIPAGPRAGAAGPGAANGSGNGRNERWVKNGASANGGSIFDRVGSPGQQPGAINPAFATNAGPGYEAISSTIEAVASNNAHPSVLASIPFATLQSHPQAAYLNPQILAQAQAHAMAQAQAFAAMQGQQIAWNQGYNTNNNLPPVTYNPAYLNGRGGGQMNNGRNQPQYQQQQNYQQQQQQQYLPPPPPAQSWTPPTPAVPITYQSKKFIAPPVLPTKPAEEQICKHETECSRPACPYSHPSPVATKESGLVLSSEPCELQLLCKDIDCPRSHVSPSQLKLPVPTTTTSSTSSPAFSKPVSSSIPIRAPAIISPASIPGAGERSCKFANACTRAGCVFLHPWDARGDESAVPCRWAEACTRADCHFTHPSNRPVPYSKSAPKSYSANYSKPATIPSIGAWPTEKKEHISDRLKRFAGATQGETERIIPGGGAPSVVVEVEEEKKEAGENVVASGVVPVV